MSMKEALDNYKERINSLINDLGNGVPSTSENNRQDEQLHIRTPDNNFINWRDKFDSDINKLEVCFVRFDKQ
jgi:hypothetical protein